MTMIYLQISDVSSNASFKVTPCLSCSYYNRIEDVQANKNAALVIERKHQLAKTGSFYVIDLFATKYRTE